MSVRSVIDVISDMAKWWSLINYKNTSLYLIIKIIRYNQLYRNFIPFFYELSMQKMYVFYFDKKLVT